MEKIIRRSTPADLDLLEQIEKQSFPEYQQSSRQSLKLSLKSDYQQVWLIELKNQDSIKIAGSMVLYLYKKSVRIYSIAVLPEFKGLGLGLLLLDHAKKIAKERGNNKILLEANSRNLKLIKWYETAGFYSTELLEDYYAEGIHAVKMMAEI